MNTLVCIKQVPDTAEMKVDPATNTLVRTGDAIVNPYDTYALELAVRLRERQGGRVAVLSMGPPQAEEALRDCLAVGADEAYLICGRVFAGADTLATSYTLSAAVREIERRCGEGFDLILCGKQSVDGETGQVGPELAEALGCAQITCASQLEASGGKLTARRELDDGFERVESPLPVVVSVVKSDIELAFPSIRTRLDALEAQVAVFDEDSLPFDREKVGAAGSPTTVGATFIPETTRSRTVVREATAAESAKKLAGLLRAGGTL